MRPAQKCCASGGIRINCTVPRSTVRLTVCTVHEESVSLKRQIEYKKGGEAGGKGKGKSEKATVKRAEGKTSARAVSSFVVFIRALLSVTAYAWPWGTALVTLRASQGGSGDSEPPRGARLFYGVRVACLAL